MKIDPIQSSPVDTAVSNAVNSPGKDSNFSSYLQTTASMEQIFKEASETYGIDINLLKAIAKAESDFNPNATSGCGAQGVMQLMPATAASLGVTNSYDPYQNIMGGSKYISELMDKYNGDTTLALAAYNAGMNNVAKYGGVPPFEETQNYVVKVTGYMNQNFNLPSTSYSRGNVTTPVVTVTAAHINKTADTPSESVMEQLFSYDDYLDFIELYTKIQELQEEQDKKEDEKQEEDEKDATFSYQGIHYNPAVLNLINNTEAI